MGELTENSSLDVSRPCAPRAVPGVVPRYRGNGMAGRPLRRVGFRHTLTAPVGSGPPACRLSQPHRAHVDPRPWRRNSRAGPQLRRPLAAAAGSGNGSDRTGSFDNDDGRTGRSDLYSTDDGNAHRWDRGLAPCDLRVGRDMADLVGAFHL